MQRPLHIFNVLGSTTGACIVFLKVLGPDLKIFILVAWDRSSLSFSWSTGAQLMIVFCYRFPVVLFDRPGITSVMQHVVSIESSSLLLHSIET